MNDFTHSQTECWSQAWVYTKGTRKRNTVRNKFTKSDQEKNKRSRCTMSEAKQAPQKADLTQNPKLIMSYIGKHVQEAHQSRLGCLSHNF